MLLFGFFQFDKILLRREPQKKAGPPLDKQRTWGYTIYEGYRMTVDPFAVFYEMVTARGATGRLPLFIVQNKGNERDDNQCHLAEL